MQHLDNLFGDRHFYIMVLREFQDRLTTLISLAGLLGGRNRLLHGQTLPEIFTEGPISGQR